MKVKLMVLLALVLVTSFVAQTPTTKKGASEIVASAAARVPGQLTGDGEPIIVPSSIRAGTDFELTVRTGGDGCWTKGDASVVLGETTADIFVYDMTNATRPGTMCTMIYKQFDHKVRLRFAEKGEALIRVWTRTAGDGPVGKPVIVEKRVTVK